MGDLFINLAIALALGLLVGLQRERSNSRIAGIRTFPLITLFGSLSALLSQQFGAWGIVGGFVALAAVLVVANLVKSEETVRADPGQTTEVAALVMFALGAYLMVGSRAAAIAIGGVVAVLLHLKEPMRSFVERMRERDLRAIMQFVLIALVILPVLPNEPYGPYDVWNPFEIWQMVVLIVGIGLAGYAAYKFFGDRAGTFLGGILGGLISSTATTVSYARRTKESPDAAGLAAVVIMIASTVAFARVIVEIAVVAPSHVVRMGLPLGAMFVAMALLSLGLYFFTREREDSMPEQGNPAELKSAIVFGALYALVLVAVAAARDWFGREGLYVVAVLSGLTDVDAITLSTSNMVVADRLAPDTGWRLVLIASMSNLLFKGGTAAVLGGRRLGLRIGAVFLIAIAAGGLVLLLWPEA